MSYETKRQSQRVRSRRALNASEDAAPSSVDMPLTTLVVSLVAFGVVMVYSASAVYANRMFGDGYHFVVRQAIFAGIALSLMWIVSRIDYRHWRALTYPMLIGTIALMIAVSVGLGKTAGGATRWIQVGGINIQPAEFAKLTLILWLAYSLAKKQERMRSFSIGFLPHALIAGLLMLLCLLQPDFGSAVMLGLLCFVMLFAGGAKLGYLLGAVVALAPAAYFLVASSPYRMRRIRAFLSPFEYRQDEGYQITESLLGFGAGGFGGVGLGDSRQKLLFLPEAHTDFISAIVGEELGFIGVCMLALVFLGIVVRGLQIAWRALDDYGSYLAVGASLFIGLQAFTNLAVAMGLLPTKGLALPFVSYGGSSLVVNCFALGLLLSISRFQVVTSRHNIIADKEVDRRVFRWIARGEAS